METDFEILGHVIADHYRAVVRLQQENAAVRAENEQLRAELLRAVGGPDGDSTARPGGQNVVGNHASPLTSDSAVVPPPAEAETSLPGAISEPRTCEPAGDTEQ